MDNHYSEKVKKTFLNINDKLIDLVEAYDKNDGDIVDKAKETANVVCNGYSEFDKYIHSLRNNFPNNNEDKEPNNKSINSNISECIDVPGFAIEEYIKNIRADIYHYREGLNKGKKPINSKEK